MRLPKAQHPPKLQHVLNKRRRHDLVKKIKQDEDAMGAPGEKSVGSHGLKTSLQERFTA